MLTLLFVQITIMSAALGIISHNPHLSDSRNLETPIGVLDALLQRMYVNSSKPYESNLTELFGPKYEELFKKPLLELLEGKKEEVHGQKAQDSSEKDPLLLAFTTNTSTKSVNTENKTSNSNSSRNLDQNTTDSDSDLILENDDELQPIKTKEKLNDSVRESSKQNKSESFKEDLGKTFTENLKDSVKEHLKENQKENLKGSLTEQQKESSEDLLKENLHKLKEKSKDKQPEISEANAKENLKENKASRKEKEHHSLTKNNFTEQKLNELADLEQVLRYFTQLIEQHPRYISSAKSAITNSTDNVAISNATNNKTEEASQVSLDVTESPPSANLTANLTDILNHLPANLTNDLNWYKPQSKSLSHFVRNSSALAGKNFSESATTEQNIEFFQNFFSYRKIPYPLLSSPLLANWTQSISVNNSTAHSGKTKPKHSWMHSGSSNSSFHIKNSLIDPISKAQIQLEKSANSKSENEPACLMAVNATKVAKTLAFPTTTTMISKMAATHSELSKVPPLPNFNSRFDGDPAEMLRKCWIELNKTKSEIRQHERQKQDAITCIIPRQNTSIFYGHTPEPVPTKSGGFCKFFNKKEKKERKKKVTPSRPIFPSSVTEMKARTKPTTISTTVRHEPDCSKDRDRGKENEVYDEGINKILEDISSKMCLPNMINRLLELVCQNGTNSSLSSTHPGHWYAEHSLHATSENHQNHNHNHNRTPSATRLGGNDYKTRRVDQSYTKTKFSDNSRVRNYLPINYLDKNSHQTAHWRLKSEGNGGNRDLSNILFFVGMNKNENSAESNTSPLEKSDFDVAYMRP